MRFSYNSNVESRWSSDGQFQNQLVWKGFEQALQKKQNFNDSGSVVLQVNSVRALQEIWKQILYVFGFSWPFCEKKCFLLCSQLSRHQQYPRYSIIPKAHQHQLRTIQISILQLQNFLQKEDNCSSCLQQVCRALLHSLGI